MKNVLELILTTKLLMPIAALITAMQKHKVDDITSEILIETGKNMTSEQATLAMMHASGIYGAYHLGLKHGREGTPLDTSYLEKVIEAKEAEAS